MPREPVIRRRLHRYNVHELSLVFDPDINRRALVIKNAGATDTLTAEQIADLQERITKSRLPVLDGVNNPQAEQQMLDQQTQRTLQAVARLLAPHKDQLTVQDIVDIGQAVGLPDAQPNDIDPMTGQAIDPAGAAGPNEDAGDDYGDAGIDAVGEDDEQEDAQGDINEDDGSEGEDDPEDTDVRGDLDGEGAGKEAERSSAPPSGDDLAEADDDVADAEEGSEGTQDESQDVPAGEEKGDAEAEPGDPEKKGDDAQNDDQGAHGKLKDSINWQTPPPKHVDDEDHAAATDKAKGAYLDHLKKKGYALKPTGKKTPPPNAAPDKQTPRVPGKRTPPMGTTQVNKNSQRPDLSQFTPAQREELELIVKSAGAARREVEKLAADKAELIEKNKSMETRLKAMEDALDQKELVQKFAEFRNLTDQEKLVKICKGMAPEQREDFLALCKSQNEQLARVTKSRGAGLFEEVGSRHGGEHPMRTGDDDAESELDKLVQERVTKSATDGKEPLTYESALVQVLKSKPGRDAYNRAENARMANSPAVLHGLAGMGDR